jgi:hypothetical protein
MPAYHAVPRIFAYVHARASHGATPALRRKWKSAEVRLLARYSPNLWRLVRQGVKTERI